MIDSPVTRSVDMAWQGRSALLIGGEDSYVARAMSILRAVSDLQTHCGPLGNGSAMKLANNFLSATGLAATCEAIASRVSASQSITTNLVEVLPQYRSIELGVYAVYASRRHVAPKVRVLIDFLVEAFRIRAWGD